MSDVIATISNLKGLMFLGSVPRDNILDAQKKLGLLFADDYKEYLERYGAISANGIELTGLTIHKRLNVVDVTLEERDIGGLPQGMYVVEDTHNEGILILQNSAGEVYKFYGKNRKIKIFDCLADYLESKMQ
jgi:hypothetical protein